MPQVHRSNLATVPSSLSLQFNTFGGSTASCVAALTTLRVIREEGLQGRAREVSRNAAARVQGCG